VNGWLNNRFQIALVKQTAEHKAKIDRDLEAHKGSTFCAS
jgi:hypothetical protein